MDPRALRNPENMYPFLYDQYYLLIFLNFFFDVWSSSISSIVRAWVSIIEWFCKGESLGNGKSTERFVKKIDKNSILLFIWSFFNYISHLSELEFYFLCDCTNQKRKTIERCVKERLEQVVRVQLFFISWDKRKCWEFWLRLALL